MAVASLNRMKSRLNAILLLNDGAYSSTNSGVVGRYSSDQEIIDAILQTDIRVCEAIIDTPNHIARPAFLIGLSGNILSGGLLPAALGAIGNVTLSNDGITYAPGKLAQSKDEVSEVLEVGTLVYGDSFADFAGFYFLEDNRLYHTSAQAKVTYCVLAISSVPQAPDSEEETIIQGALSSLAKDGAASESIHMEAGRKFQGALNRIRSFPRIFPEQQMAEAQMNAQ